jgi:demethylmenaquinone methyltransferase / 2-methoxy-6-polyprenyl-1,4-benzoquinol methylase
MPDPVAVNTMFARIARRYDVANRMLSGGMDVVWRRRLVGAVKAITPRSVLDLATGSGDVAFSLGRKLAPDTEIIGMDFCQPMLDEAEIKKREYGGFSNISFRQGDGLALPLEDQQFDAVTISFGLRNMQDRAKCLSEMRRVLRKSGRVFILEFSQPYRWFRPFYFFYLRHVLPRLAGGITGDRAAYDYLNSSIEQFPGREEMSKELTDAGFTDIHARPMTFGIVALHVGKK